MLQQRTFHQHPLTSLLLGVIPPDRPCKSVQLAPSSEHALQAPQPLQFDHSALAASDCGMKTERLPSKRFAVSAYDLHDRLSSSPSRLSVHGRRLNAIASPNCTRQQGNPTHWSQVVDLRLEMVSVSAVIMQRLCWFLAKGLKVRNDFSFDDALQRIVQPRFLAKANTNQPQEGASFCLWSPICCQTTWRVADPRLR